MMRASSSVSPNSSQTLYVIRAADLTLTTDQAFTKVFAGTNYIVSNIFAVRKSGAFGVACLGGVYTGAAKSADVVVAAVQSWASLTGANTAATANLANLLQTKALNLPPILSLTTGNTGALTADIFIVGTVVD